MSDLSPGASRRCNKRNLVAKTVMAWPLGHRFTTGDVLAAIPDRPGRSMTVRSVAAILAGLDGVVCEGIPPSHALAKWRRVRWWSTAVS